jgi:Protein of unknown function (DUF3147)
MIPSVELKSLKQTSWRQLALRFVLGGTVTLCTGLIARHWGPVIGGLFLSFPAIFSAAATLVARNESERRGATSRRGRKASALEAAGAMLGACALSCFGACAWLLLPSHSALWVLPLAALVWLSVASALWWARRQVRAAGL